jgi:hypothetical protein
MRKHWLKWLIGAAPALVACLASGQAPPPDAYPVPLLLERKPEESRNRISLAYQMGLNITVDFKKLGGFTPLSNPGPASGGVTNRTYDNGYNLVDITGNDHGPGYENTTWNWSYTDPSSIQGNSIVVSSSSSLANGVSKNNSDDPQSGVAIIYDRELYRDPTHNWRFGLEGALGYTLISISDNRTLRTTVNQTIDSYSLPAGFVVPQSPYYGTYEGPGPVISSDPLSRSTNSVSAAATVSGHRTIDANVFNLKLGPYAEVPLSSRFSLLFSGGLYLAVGDIKFSYKQTVTIDGVGSQVSSGSGSQTDFLYGGYVGGNLQYALTKEMGLFVGAQFQSAGQTVNREQGKQAILDMGQSVIVSIGASYSF